MEEVFVQGCSCLKRGGLCFICLLIVLFLSNSKKRTFLSDTLGSCFSFERTVHEFKQWDLIIFVKLHVT